MVVRRVIRKAQVEEVRQPILHVRTKEVARTSEGETHFLFALEPRPLVERQCFDSGFVVVDEAATQPSVAVVVRHLVLEYLLQLAIPRGDSDTKPPSRVLIEKQFVVHV